MMRRMNAIGKLKMAACLIALAVPMIFQAGRAQDGDPPDISGVYRAGRADPPCGFQNFENSEDCPITETALERVATVSHYDDPGLRCEPDALSRLFTRLPRPVEIIQEEGRIRLHYQYFGIMRTIHMGENAAPPPDLEHSLHGYSVGRWEGDTLVVETTRLTENLFTLPNSDQLRTVERYTPNADGSLTLDVEIHDPVFYERPYSLGRAEFVPTPDDYIGEWDCTSQAPLFSEDEFNPDSFFDDQ